MLAGGQAGDALGLALEDQNVTLGEGGSQQRLAIVAGLDGTSVRFECSLRSIAVRAAPT